MASAGPRGGDMHHTAFLARESPAAFHSMEHDVAPSIVVSGARDRKDL